MVYKLEQCLRSQSERTGGACPTHRFGFVLSHQGVALFAPETSTSDGHRVTGRCWSKQKLPSRTLFLLANIVTSSKALVTSSFFAKQNCYCRCFCSDAIILPLVGSVWPSLESRVEAIATTISYHSQNTAELKNKSPEASALAGGRQAMDGCIGHDGHAANGVEYKHTTGRITDVYV